MIVIANLCLKIIVHKVVFINIFSEGSLFQHFVNFTRIESCI